MLCFYFFCAVFAHCYGWGMGVGKFDMLALQNHEICKSLTRCPILCVFFSSVSRDKIGVINHTKLQTDVAVLGIARIIKQCGCCMLYKYMRDGLRLKGTQDEYKGQVQSPCTN